MQTGVLPVVLLFLLRVKLISAIVLSVPHRITLGQNFIFNWTRGSADPDEVVLWPVSSNGSDTPVVHHTDYYLNMSSQSSGRATWQFNNANLSMQPGSYLIYVVPDNNGPTIEPPSGDTLAGSMLGLSNQFILDGSPACSPGLDTCTTATATSILSLSSEIIPPTSFNTPTPSQNPLPSTSKAHVSGMMIGIILASTVALLSVFALIIYLLLRRRRRRRTANALSVEDGRTDSYSKLEAESTRTTSPSGEPPNTATRQESAGVEKPSRVPSALERSWWDDAP